MNIPAGIAVAAAGLSFSSDANGDLIASFGGEISLVVNSVLLVCSSFFNSVVAGIGSVVFIGYRISTGKIDNLVFIYQKKIKKAKQIIQSQH